MTPDTSPSEYPLNPTSARITNALAIEARSFSAAVIAALSTSALAFVIFWGRNPPLSGEYSVGLVASIGSALVSVMVFSIFYNFGAQRPETSWRKELPVPIRIYETLSLAFTHAAIAFMLCLAMFYIFQGAFKSLTLDALSGALFVGIACGGSAYAVALSGARITTYSLSNLLAVFLVTGALTAMVTSDNQGWWQINFSVLGARDSGVAAYAFNATLILSGLAITTLATYLSRDLKRWAVFTHHQESTNVAAIQWNLIILGLLLATVGLLPVDQGILPHNSAATGTLLSFVVLMVGIHFWIPAFPRSFFLTSYVIAGLLVLSVLLWWPLGYYNLTGLELAATALVFGWLVLFIRNIAALSEDAEREHEGSKVLGSLAEWS